MRSRLLAVGGLVALLCTATPLVVRAQTDTNPTPAPETTAPAPTAPAPNFKQGKHHREKHPELMKAMRALQRAQTDLAHANRDFDGHRAKAADLTAQAIEEIKAAMQADQN